MCRGEGRVGPPLLASVAPARAVGSRIRQVPGAGARADWMAGRRAGGRRRTLSVWRACADVMPDFLRASICFATSASNLRVCEIGEGSGRRGWGWGRPGVGRAIVVGPGVASRWPPRPRCGRRLAGLPMLRSSTRRRVCVSRGVCAQREVAAEPRARRCQPRDCGAAALSGAPPQPPRGRAQAIGAGSMHREFHAPPHSLGFLVGLAPAELCHDSDAAPAARHWGQRNSTNSPAPSNPRGLHAGLHRGRLLR